MPIHSWFQSALVVSGGKDGIWEGIPGLHIRSYFYEDKFEYPLAKTWNHLWCHDQYVVAFRNIASVSTQNTYSIEPKILGDGNTQVFYKLIKYS